MEYLIKSTSGKPWEQITSWIDCQCDLETIYHNLLTNYDKRMRPGEAKEKLSNFKIPRNMNLAEGQSKIMLLCSRAAATFPRGESRNMFYNIESGQALIKALPPTSSALAHNKYQSQCSQYNRPPTFAEFVKCLMKFTDTINEDIRRNGVYKDSLTDNNQSNRSSQPFREFQRRAKINEIKTRQFQNNNSGFRNNGFNSVREQNSRPQNKQSYNVQSERPQNNRARSAPSQRRTLNKTGYDQRNHHINEINNKTRYRNNERSEGSSSPKKHCALCGRSSHNAADGCWYIRDNANKIQLMSPAYEYCKRCHDKKNMKLYHSEALCPDRKELDKFRKQTGPKRNFRNQQ